MKNICSSLQELSDNARKFAQDNSDAKFSVNENKLSFIFEAKLPNDEIYEWCINKIAKVFSSDHNKKVIDRELFTETVATIGLSELINKRI